MGFLDRIIKNVANDVLYDAARQVEQNVSSAISGKVTTLVDDYSQATEQKIADKKSDLRNQIIEASKSQKLPDIVANEESTEILKFGSQSQIQYHYTDPEKGIDTLVPMTVIGSMLFNITESGSYIGNDRVAHALSDAVLTAVQTTLDELSEKHIAPEELIHKQGITITLRTTEKVKGVCDSYNITSGNVMFSVIHPTADYSPTAATGNTDAAGPHWLCPYCGSKAAGLTCPSCGAAYEQ